MPNNYMMPQGGFEQGLQIAQYMMQRRKIAEAEQQKRARAEAIQTDLGALQKAPTPDAYAKLYLKYPELKESLDAYRTTLADDEKQTLLGATREALTLRRAGKGAEVPAMFDRYATALEGKPGLVKKFKDAKRIYELDPEKSGGFALETLFQSLDPDGYKAHFTQTAAIQNWEYFKEAVGEEDAKRIIGADDDVTVTTPNGGFYAGPRSGLAEALNGGGPRPPRVSSKAEYDAVAPGAVFEDENGVRRVKPGGQSGKPAGDFQVTGIPGERITSMKRSPARNRAVGGVANSYHLSGRARDSVPPAGMTMAAYAAELRRLNPGMDVINEGDHVHMEPRS